MFIAASSNPAKASRSAPARSKGRMPRNSFSQGMRDRESDSVVFVPGPVVKDWLHDITMRRFDLAEKWRNPLAEIRDRPLGSGPSIRLLSLLKRHVAFSALMFGVIRGVSASFGAD